MLVDVQTEIEIERPRADVAAYAADPDNATAWYENIKSVEWKTARPLAVGSRVAFVATFLGRRLAYTYAITEFVPGERFVMSTADGPFAMETTYSWEDTTPGSTRMILRNRGEPTGFSKLAAPIIGKAMRRATRKDLQRLKAILEAHSLPHEELARPDKSGARVGADAGDEFVWPRKEGLLGDERPSDPVRSEQSWRVSARVPGDHVPER